MGFCITERICKFGKYCVASVSKRAKGFKNPIKEIQIGLGYVVNKAKNIFRNRKDGIFCFNTETGEKTSPNLEDIPPNWREFTGKEEKALVDFGDSYVLNKVIWGTGYNTVLESIKFGNMDSFYALVHYYTLEADANRHALTWYEGNYALYLYPRANIASQRISDLLTHVGSPEVKRRYIVEHMKFVLGELGCKIKILVDSTDIENDCNLDMTHLVSKDGILTSKFKVVAIVLRDSGIPLYYEAIHGNIIDSSTLERLILVLQQYQCQVEYCICDAGYQCPKNIERLLMLGVGMMMRMNPAYKTYNDVVNSHIDNLDSKENLALFGDRYVYVMKIKTVVAISKETKEEIEGYVYLCKDLKNSDAQCARMSASKKKKDVKTEEYFDKRKRFGVFAIVSTEDLAKEEVLSEYYMRQKIEQFFDFSKNYAKFVPVRVHNDVRAQGHLLLGFIATFLTILIKNKLKFLDTQHTSSNEDWSCESPKKVFSVLRTLKADVFPNAIIPAIPTKDVNDVLKALSIESPTSIDRTGDKIEPCYQCTPKVLKKEDFITISPSCIVDEKTDQKHTASTSDESEVEFTQKNTEDTSQQSVASKKIEGKASENKKKPGVPKGTKRPDFNLDGSPRKKPGRKPKTTEGSTAPQDTAFVQQKPIDEHQQTDASQNAGTQPSEIKKKPGVAKGTKRPDFNLDGSPRKKPGVAKGTKRPDFNLDGSPRKKPGRKPKTFANNSSNVF